MICVRGREPVLRLLRVLPSLQHPQLPPPQAPILGGSVLGGSRWCFGLGVVVDILLSPCLSLGGVCSTAGAIQASTQQQQNVTPLSLERALGLNTVSHA
ncbi:unnamed protein product [Pleuronectes platessa]|uniref:Uncharacterized protein n=1 Tax=Pleuronectes platessa TaxID=8262 RepID=A0A9N7U1T5_PLEPL|nr:unnamed protein product [Pleuronectes platessa]